MGVRRPRVGRARGRGPTLAGVAVLVTLFSGCATTARPLQVTTTENAPLGSISPISPPSVTVPSTYCGQAQSRRPFLQLSASLRGDATTQRHFKAGRRAAHAFAHQAVTMGRPVAPKLPAELVPLQPELRARAETAYTLGFNHQVDLDSNYQNSDAVVTAVVIDAGLIRLLPFDGNSVGAAQCGAGWFRRRDFYAHSLGDNWPACGMTSTAFFSL